MEKIGTAQNDMPELPEVETIKNLLKSNLINKTIKSIEIIREKTILSNPLTFKNELINKTFLDIKRKGKFLLFFFSDDLVLIAHLRMEGKYYLLKESELNSKYPKIIFHLFNDEKLIFDDSRCFGIMKLSTKSNYLNENELKDLGLDAIEDISSTYFLNRVKNQNECIKSILLDQTVIAGIGNIYADESLYRSNINPLTPIKNIKEEEIQNLLINVKNILNDAIKSGGSTIKSYHPGKGIDGNFQVKLLCYGKRDENCPICHHHFRYKKVNGRGTTYCPNCQKKKGKPIVVGLCGLIAAGKSTICKIFSDNNIDTYSADEIVSKLYKEESVINKINRITGLNFVDNVDKNILRIYIIEHPDTLKKINKIIHPLVKNKCIEIIKNNKKDIILFEIPLLFEANMEELFDYIIGVEISKDIQLKRLSERNKSSSISLAKINDSSTYNENKNRLDFIIENNLTLNHLNKETINLINILKSYLN